MRAYRPNEPGRHRCRLYRLNKKLEDAFVEVWDTEEAPYEHSGDSLPSGKVVVTCVGNSFEDVRSHMNRIRQDRSIFIANDWASRGSL